MYSKIIDIATTLLLLTATFTIFRVSRQNSRNSITNSWCNYVSMEKDLSKIFRWTWQHMMKTTQIKSFKCGQKLIYV